MRVGNWLFLPGFWPTAATLVLLPAFLSLGFWQLDRADQKSRLHEQFVQHQSAGAMELNVPGQLRLNKPDMLWRNVLATGSFSITRNILLDNQVMHGQAGYFVFTPFCMVKEDVWVLVNRGWVPANDNRRVLPEIHTPSGTVQISGVATEPPATGLFLGKDAFEKLADSTYRAQRIDMDEIMALTGHDLLPYVVTLAPESEHGYARTWQPPGSGRERHLGYAFQWFAFAVTLGIVYLAVNLKRSN